jgi:hypothetical protein
MSTKKRDWAKEQADRLEARLNLGKADRRWREINGLSQQNCHDWSKASGIPLHNSQVAYWERGSLDPKGEFWFAREAYNAAIADKLFPSGLSRTVRDRMKAAEPFLTYDGRVATALDFQAMFGNRQPINSIYTKAEKITDELLAEFAEALATTYRWVGKENMTNNKETWREMLKSKSIKRVEEPKLIDFAQDVLLGEKIPTEKDIKYVLTKYKDCPLVSAYRSLVDKPLPKQMENIHSKLQSIVTAT